MTDKTVNYTPEQTAQLVAKYNDGVSVESLAEMFGKTTRSIVAKLSREGVYHAKSKSTGVARVKKLLILWKKPIMKSWKQSSQTCVD